MTLVRLVLGLALLGGGAASAFQVTGTVFEDRDGDGLLSGADVPVAGSVVAWEGGVFVQTGADGRYALEAPGPGIVWNRVPDGFVIRPLWRSVAAAATVDFPLIPAARSGPIRFVHVSDTHVGVIGAEDTAQALAKAAAVEPPPAFLVITGDLTQSDIDSEYQVLVDAIGDLPLPVVAVPGNHDWYSGGDVWRRHFGPPSYSFDAGGVHFIVLEMPQNGWDNVLGFLRGDLGSVAAGTPIAVFQHVPPALEGDLDFVDELATRGVRWLFTGHWHQNRRLDDGSGVIDFNMQPLAMGGMDFTPGGFRVVTIDGGEVLLEHHTVLDDTYLRVVHPLPDACVTAGPLEAIVAAEAGARPITLWARLDDGPAVDLSAAGGWDWRGALGPVAAGEHRLEVGLEGDVSAQRLAITFCAGEVPEIGPGVWEQLQGGPTRLGVAGPVVGPLRTRWATAVGGHLRGGSPVVSGGRVFVSVIDPGDGARGGLVALDAVTGAILWEQRMGESVHNAPAVGGDTVVVARSGGLVEAYAAGDGTLRWQLDVAEGLPEGSANLWASPTIADGVVYVGVVRNLAAIDLATGVPLWQRNPSREGIGLDLTPSSLGVADGLLVGLFGRGYEGIQAFDAATGALLWLGPADLSIGTAASPVLAGGTVYTASSSTDVYTLGLETGGMGWHVKLNDEGFNWGYWVAATPALAEGILVVPTQTDGVVALDAADGDRLWSAGADDAALRNVHYRTHERPFQAAPVVAGDLVWIGGADGRLRGLALADGQLVHLYDLGAPILAGVAPATNGLYVSTWDGTVRALVTDPASTDPPLPRDEGCGCRAGHGGSGAAVLLVLFALARRRRRRGAARR